MQELWAPLWLRQSVSQEMVVMQPQHLLRMTWLGHETSMALSFSSYALETFSMVGKHPGGLALPSLHMCVRNNLTPYSACSH